MTNKSPKLSLLVKCIFRTFGENDIKITDHWKEDPNAVGISDLAEENLVYIATYSEDNVKFFVSLELPPKGDDEFPYTQGEEFDDIEERDILQLIKTHLLKIK